MKSSHFASLVALLFITLSLTSMINNFDETKTLVPEEVIEDVSGRAITDWDWSTQFGSTGNDQSWGIIVDSQGNSYVTGTYSDTINFGAAGSLTSAGGRDVFIAKVDSLGDFVWVETGGGGGDDAALAIIELANGNFAITGYVEGGYSSTFGSITSTVGGKYSLLIATFDTTGNWIWAKYSDGPHVDALAHGFDIDADGSNIFVTGKFEYGIDFDTIQLTTAATPTGCHPNSSDIFVAKLDYAGNYIYAKKAGDECDDLARTIAVDSNGDLYVGGYYGAGPVTFGQSVVGPNPGNMYEGIISKMDSNGNWLWAIELKGSNVEIVRDLKVLQSGDIIVTTHFLQDITLNDLSGNSFGSSPYSATSSYDVILASLSPSGTWNWAQKLGGTGENTINAMFTNDADDIFITGEFSNTLLLGTTQLSGSSGIKTFVAKLDDAGNWFWATQVTGQKSKPYGIGIDGNNVPYIVGKLEMGPTTFDNAHTSVGSYDGFIAKLNNSYAPVQTNPCSSFNGIAGPISVWDPITTIVTAGEIYEYPAATDQYWLAIMDTSNPGTPIPGQNPDVWDRACDCEDIWENNPNNPMQVWTQGNQYLAYEIVEYPASSGILWVAQQSTASSTTAVSPDNDPDLWKPCNSCVEFNGLAGPTLNRPGTTTPSGIVEDPTSLGTFYTLVTPSTTTSFVTTPAQLNGSKWDGPCSCDDIWRGGGRTTWDATTIFDEWEIVEYPIGSDDLWVSLIPSNIDTIPPGTSPNWVICGSGTPPCKAASLSGNIWTTWENPIVNNPPISPSSYNIGSSVMHGNGFFVSLSNANTNPPAGPNGTLYANGLQGQGDWVECDCSEIGASNAEYDDDLTYTNGQGVDLDGTPYWAITDVQGVFPNALGWQQFWRTCNWCDSSTNNLLGTWNIYLAASGNSPYTLGTIVTYNGLMYMSIMNDNNLVPGGTTSVTSTTISSAFRPVVQHSPWISQGWIECNCADLAMEYTAGQSYNLGDIILGPDNQVWISKYSNNNQWPAISFGRYHIPTWKLCHLGNCNDANPWNSLTASAGGYFSGDAVSHIGHSWKLLQGHSGSSLQPSTTMLTMPGPWTTCRSIPVGPGGGWGVMKSAQTDDNDQTDMHTPTKSSSQQPAGHKINTLLKSADLTDEIGGVILFGIDSSLKSVNTSEVDIAILIEGSIMDLDQKTLSFAIENNIWIVRKCADVYNLSSEEGEMLCGIWMESSEEWNISGSSKQLLHIEPGYLCPKDSNLQGYDSCQDIVLEYFVSSEQKGSSTNDDEGGFLPGFLGFYTVFSLIAASLIFRRKNNY